MHARHHSANQDLSLRHRVILDEAHNIKDRQANTAKAAFALRAHYRWCLSGTPLQNRVGELYSLIRFVGCDPFAFYFCKRCDCKSLHWLCSKGPCSVSFVPSTLITSAPLTH